MKKIFKILLYTFLALFVFFIALIFRPSSIVSEAEALVTKGRVTEIYEGGVKDVVFRLENDHHIYYINRGLENGLELENLRQRLIGQNVTFKYPKHWTPLDWNTQTIHLSKVSHNKNIIFNELKP